MEIDTPYAVKLFFSTSAFVQVFFEAVANAFDAEATEIAIRVLTEPLEITITDNGKGFTKERFERFRRLTEPNDAYHKGLGRLVYLNYFASIEINSIFGDTKRTFMFSNTFDGNSKTAPASKNDNQGTALRFTSFVRPRLRTNDDIKPENLKSKLLEQFLPLLHEKKKRGEHFKIEISLEERITSRQAKMFSDSATITESDVPTLACKTFKDNSLDAFEEISMYYMLRHGGGKELQLTAACIDGRTIPIKLLTPNAIPHTHTAIFLFESKLFTGRSDSARQRLVLPETIDESTLRRVLRREMSAVLNKELPEIEQKNAETKQRFEERYPHLMGLFDEDSVGLIDKDEAIEAAQVRFFQQQRKILDSDKLDDATFEKSLEVSSRTLTEYILYRELIIKRLSEITANDSEALIHNLIVPQRQQFHGEALLDGIYNNNAWLLDDKFMTFRTLLSEAEMQELIAAIAPGEHVNDAGRPDISMIFSSDPTQTTGVDVVVVELKRRKADAKENTFAGMQLVQRAMRLANYCHAIQRIWYFAVIEIDEPLSQLLMTDNYVPLFSRGNHVYYREFPVKRADGVTVPTPVCLLSFDAIIKDAAARNHTFLEILKSAFKKASARAGSQHNRDDVA